MNEYYPYKKKPFRFNNPIDVMMHFHTKGIGHGCYWDREKVRLHPVVFEIVFEISKLTEKRRQLIFKRKAIKGQRFSDYSFTGLSDKQLFESEELQKQYVVDDRWMEYTRKLLVNEDDIADLDAEIKYLKKQFNNHPHKNLRLHCNDDDLQNDLEVFNLSNYIDISETEGVLL